jgi:HK97 family phage portal protein
MGVLASALRSYWLGPYSSGDKALASLFAGPNTAAGVPINSETALNLSAVWAAVTVISGTVASLPLILYKRLQNGGRERFLSHPLYKILHDAPNPEMTSMVFRELLQSHVLLWGNAYAEIQRDASDRPAALWPITPDRVTPERNQRDEVVYRVTGVRGADVIVPARDILHIPGLGWDGLRGYSVISKARESLGLSKAAENFGAQFFGNGAVAGGVAMHPGQLSKTASENIERSIREQIGGAKRFSTLVLEEGMRWEKATIPPDDAQFLETRKFQITEIARWFNLPPHKLRDLERATYSNIEHQGIDFVIDLRLWLVRIEQECNRKLIRPLESGLQYVEHLVDGLLRGDTTTRFNAYAVARNWGWMSADDVRERENLNPLPNGAGQVYLVPANMIPADRVDDVIDAQVRPPAPPVAPEAPAEEDEPEEEAASVRVARIVEVLRQEIAAHRPPMPALPAPLEPAAIVEPVAVILDQMRAEVAERADGTAEAIAAAAATIAAGLARDDDLRAWRQATLGMIAGRVVRRELAQVRKLATDPERASERLAAFYARLVEDTTRSLRDLPEPIRGRLGPCLEQWASDAQADALASLADGGLAGLELRWADRHLRLTATLVEVTHGAGG